MRPHFRPVVLVFATSVLLMQAAHASDRGTYRWVDEKGRVHYSDVRTEKSQPVQIKPGSGAANAPKESAAAVEAKRLDCQRKKDQVAVYTSSAQISETDSLGNTRNYTAAERQQLIERAQQQVSVACGEAGAKPVIDGDATFRN